MFSFAFIVFSQGTMTRLARVSSETRTTPTRIRHDGLTEFGTEVDETNKNASSEGMSEGLLLDPLNRAVVCTT